MDGFFRRGVCCVVVGGLLGGCSANHYRKSADKAAYAVIREKTPMVENMDPEFTIEQTNAVFLEGLPEWTEKMDFLGPTVADLEVGARVISLEKALELATRQSRTYQNRKEQVYLQALSLTLARHQWRPLFSGGANAGISGNTERAVEVVLDENTGELTPKFSDDLVERQSIRAGGRVDAAWLIRDIGRLTVSFTTAFVRYFSGDTSSAMDSGLRATFTRPLLQNAGYKQEMERLTLAERGLLYEMRNFTQFRREFSVSVASTFYRVLGLRDTARNAYSNLESSRRNAERNRAMAVEGRVTQADLGRLEQQELTAESSWVEAVVNYRQAVDDFKFQLGLPVDTNLVLEERELAELEIQHPMISVDDSVKVAFAARLDYQNARDVHDDAVRNVALQANFLKPRIDLVADVAITSDPNKRSEFNLPEYERYAWSAGLNADLPLDQTDERNSYRSALIAERLRARGLTELEDQIRLQIRDSWRTLEQAKRNHEISEISVKIAERRVEEQNLLSELGLARAQDQVDAQNALTASKNQRTQAVVAHTIARLQFWNNMGILYIKHNGHWEDPGRQRAEAAP